MHSNQYLNDNNLFEIHNMILDDAEKKLKIELETYFKNTSMEDKEYWYSYKFKIINPGKKIFTSEITGFRRNIAKVENHSSNRKEFENKKIYGNDEGYLVIEYAINWYYYDPKNDNLETHIKYIIHLFTISISNWISGYKEYED